jgi:hypothetical protein
MWAEHGDAATLFPLVAELRTHSLLYVTFVTALMAAIVGA